MKKSTLFRLAFASANPEEFSKTLYARHQALIAGFAFADAQSEINALQSFRAASLPLIPNPITIITGLPGTGKTALARVLGTATCEEVINFAANTRDQINKAVEAAVLHRFPAILFDNLFRFDCFQSIRLSEIATANPMMVRRRSQAIEEITFFPRVFITCPHDTSFPEDLARRSRIIRLAPSAHNSAA